MIRKTIAFAEATAAAAEQQLARIDALAARLRRQRIVLHSPAAGRAQEAETHLSAQLDITVRLFDTLQSPCRPAAVP